MRTLPLALLAALAFASAAHAEAYKCRLPDGQIEISNRPCTGGGTTLTVRPDETISEAQRQAAERENERMRQRADKLEADNRASDAAAQREQEREERAAARERASQPHFSPRNYSTADDCLRALDQTPMEPSQRSSMEGECRRIVTTAQPLYVPVPVATTHRPVVVIQNTPKADTKPKKTDETDLPRAIYVPKK